MSPLLGPSSDPGSWHISKPPHGGRELILERQRRWRASAKQTPPREDGLVSPQCMDLMAVKGQQGLLPPRRMDGRGEGIPWGYKCLDVATDKLSCPQP